MLLLQILYLSYMTKMGIGTSVQFPSFQLGTVYFFLVSQFVLPT